MRLLLLLLIVARLVAAQQIEGRVYDAVSGENLARVQVSLQGTGHRGLTDDGGRFLLSGVASGEFVLHVATVGYLPTRESFRLSPGETRVFEVALSPAVLRQSISVTGETGAFAREAPMAVGLSGDEVKNLASVLADDPLRAVQSLPGVTSNDDFKSEFALRGAGFQRIGVYLDGVLLHSPFHSIQGESNSASLTIFNGDTLQSLNLHAGPPPPPFGDRTAGVLDVETREGSRRRFTARATASASNAGGVVEGPLGRQGRGAWLVSARKSYLQYIIRRTSTNDVPVAFGFADVQGRASYDLTPRNNVSFSVIEGNSGLDRTGAAAGLNSLYFSDYDFTLGNLAWRYTPSSSFLVTNRLAWLSENYRNDNLDRSPLAGGAYGEWVWNSDAKAIWRGAQELQFGITMRRLREDSYINRFFFNPTALRRMDEARGTALRSGAYAQQTWNVLRGRVSGTFGGRWDTHRINGIQTLSPYSSVAVQLLPATRLQVAWGQSAQFPSFPEFTGLGGRRRLIPERASQAQVAMEQRLGERTRLRAEFYNRQDRDLLFRPYFDPRLIGGSVFNPSADAPWENSVRGYARGVQVFLQRRTANSFTGWISYSYGVARLRDGVVGRVFPSDFDQRHAVNVYGSYRLRPTVNLSSRWIYGSGLPIPGFFRRDSATYYLAENRNELRLASYQRLDFRVNKAFIRDRWQVTLFAEVVNALNRNNRRYDTFNGYDAITGRTRLGFNTMLPILPSAGVLAQF